ncbi:MAG TPA: ATP-binding protein [Gaiellaceae bacterium]|nr:ATP-binding protein [Gaiellaceae bacterium]
MGLISAAFESADERMQRTERRLIEAALAVNEADTFAAAIDLLVEAAKDLVDADRISLLEWDSDFLGARVCAGTGMRDTTGVHVPANHAIAAHVRRSEPFVVEPPLTDGLPTDIQAALAEYGTYLCVPFALGGARAFSFQAGWLASVDEDMRHAAVSKLRLLARLTRIAFRAEVERNAVRAERRLRAVLDATPDGLVVRSDEGAIVNAAARELLAVDDDPPLTIEMHELDGTQVPPHDTPLTRAYSTGVKQSYRLRVTRYDGIDRIHEGTVAPVEDDEGRVFATVTMFRDVTDEHEAKFVSERFLERLFEALPTAVAVIDPDTREIKRANRAFQELVDRPLHEIVGTLPPYAWWSDQTAELNGRDSSGRHDSLYRRADGSIVPVEVTRTLVHGLHGDVAAVVAIASDLSERREFEQRLIQSGKLASIGELAAGVAHEINNPLFAILGLVEFLLMDAEDGSKAHERLSVIQSTALEIKEIVRALLDFAREGSNERADVSVSSVVAETLELIRRTNSAKHVEIVESYEGGALVVHAASNQLKQIFVNLISNAKLAMTSGGTITIAVRREGEDACVDVRDDGPGIDAEVMERIFEPFFTTRRDSGGTGLGLSVSLGIAEAHGGSLTVDSEPGCGTTFRVRLPLVEAAA